MTITHQERMARKKEVIDARIAKATEERGVLILLRGNGKGKRKNGHQKGDVRRRHLKPVRNLPGQRNDREAGCADHEIG